MTPDYIISLKDGRKFKTLKWYLRTKGMTPDDYRANWGLPDKYAMKAPDYAKARSKLATDLDLGGNRWKTLKAAHTAKSRGAP